MRSLEYKANFVSLLLLGSVVTRALTAGVQTGIQWAIRFYQATTFWLPPCCRFYPSCSHYMAQAVQQHGPWRGVGLGLWRLMRCHPWHPGGIDPVPPSRLSLVKGPTHCQPRP